MVRCDACPRLCPVGSLLTTPDGEEVCAACFERMDHSEPYGPEERLADLQWEDTYEWR